MSFSNNDVNIFLLKSFDTSGYGTDLLLQNFQTNISVLFGRNLEIICNFTSVIG
jgi:hypothetical protein